MLDLQLDLTRVLARKGSSRLVERCTRFRDGVPAEVRRADDPLDVGQQALDFRDQCLGLLLGALEFFALYQTVMIKG